MPDDTTKLDKTDTAANLTQANRDPTDPAGGKLPLADGPDWPIDGELIEKGQLLLGVYRVETLPKAGGMGKVWRVRHTGWNVDLAMKRPKANLFQSEKQKSGFALECESWIGLGLHPLIVSCYYVREIGGVPTIFSEWMDGGAFMIGFTLQKMVA